MPHHHLRAPSAWPSGWLVPDLRAGDGLQPPGVLACMTARAGGVSLGPCASFNLGNHVGDAMEAVAANRLRAGQLMASLGREVAVGGAADAWSIGAAAGAWPVAWLEQVHGARVHRLQGSDFQPGNTWLPPQADGVLSTEPGLVCAVMVADCLPMLLAVRHGGGVAALHAGWRGLAGAGAMHGRGIVEAGVAALCEAASADPEELVAWLGPCIGPQHFQVGVEVLHAFGVSAVEAQAHPMFRPDPFTDAASPRWLADLAGLARQRLGRLGVTAVHGGHWCTVSDASRFYSYRRDGITGRQVALIALA
jgi:YfiH family protein